MNFKELEELIPQTEPDMQIGPVSLWVNEVVVDNETPDWIVVRTPFLLQGSKVVAFSPNSETKMFEFRNLWRELKNMYEKVGSEEITVDAPFEESEFGLKLTSNLQGQIEMDILYRSWAHAGYGRLEFKEKIDQSYLPPIISKLESILQKYKAI